MNDQFDAFVDMWKDEYRRLRRIGAKHSPARQATMAKMKEVCPEIADLLRVEMAMRFQGGMNDTDEARFASQFGPMVAVLKREMDDELADKKEDQTMAQGAAQDGGDDDKNGREKKIVETSSGRINVTASIFGWLQDNPLRVGDEICLGDLRLWASLFGVTETALTMPFRYYDDTRKNSSLYKAGYRFDIVNKSNRQFTVKVIEAPRAKEDVAAEAIRKVEAEAAKAIAEIKKQYGL